MNYKCDMCTKDKCYWCILGSKFEKKTCYNCNHYGKYICEFPCNICRGYSSWRGIINGKEKTQLL